MKTARQLPLTTRHQLAREVIRACALACDIDESDFFGRGRDACALRARRCAAKIMDNWLRLGPSAIADLTHISESTAHRNVHHYEVEPDALHRCCQAAWHVVTKLHDLGIRRGSWKVPQL